MINDKKIISVDIHVSKQKRHRKFVNQCALYTGQFITKLIKTYGNSLIGLKCDEKVEQQTNSLQRLDSYSFAI